MLTSANAGVPLYVDKSVQRGRVCSHKRISDKSENTVRNKNWPLPVQFLLSPLVVKWCFRSIPGVPVRSLTGPPPSRWQYPI